MRIVYVDEEFTINNAKKILCIHGDDLVYGMIIKRIKTPYGIIDVESCRVQGVCFNPGTLQGFLLVDKEIAIQPCEAEIIE